MRMVLWWVSIQPAIPLYVAGDLLGWFTHNHCSPDLSGWKTCDGGTGICTLQWDSPSGGDGCQVTAQRGQITLQTCRSSSVGRLGEAAGGRRLKPINWTYMCLSARLLEHSRIKSTFILVAMGTGLMDFKVIMRHLLVFAPDLTEMCQCRPHTLNHHPYPDSSAYLCIASRHHQHLILPSQKLLIGTADWNTCFTPTVVSFILLLNQFKSRNCGR